MGPQVLLPAIEGLVVEDVGLSGEVVQLSVCRVAKTVCCPVCGCPSTRVHSSYQRRLADVPVAGRRVAVHLRVRRFRCAQSGCSRRTFVEQEPELARPRARQTERLRGWREVIGLLVGGRPGSRLSAHLEMPVGRTTLLRLVRALPEPPIAAPRVLGVDEFAVRRGRRYGTILVDVDARRPIDLLEDPSADALVQWLHQHPGIQVICRDRDGVYANGAARGAPGAWQVADRWHLVHNLADMLERFPVRILAGGIASPAKQARLTAPAPPPSAELPQQTSGRLACRTERRHAQVQALVAGGLTITAISHQLGLDRKTVRRFARAATPADLLRPGGSRPSALDPFRSYLLQRWHEAAHVAAWLYQELRERGYRGSRRSVQRFVAGWQRSRPPSVAHLELPGPRTLAWLLLRRRSELDEADRVLLAQFCRCDPQVAAARQLTQAFLRLVRNRPGTGLGEWIGQVHVEGPAELRGFARNLRRDWAAVQAGLTVAWSSGPVEGHINR